MSEPTTTPRSLPKAIKLVLACLLCIGLVWILVVAVETLRGS